MRSGQIEAIWEPAAQRILLSAIRNEHGVAGIAVGSDFGDLEASVQQRFQPTGEAQPALGLPGYYEQTYSDGNIELVLGFGLPNWPETRREIRSIRLLTDRYATLRGLRIGDTVERYETLYGTTLTVGKDLMPVSFEDGRITSICFIMQSI